MSISIEFQSHIIDKIFDKYFINVSPYDKELLPQLYKILKCKDDGSDLKSSGYTEMLNITDNYIDNETGEIKLIEFYRMMDSNRYNDDVIRYLFKILDYYRACAYEKVGLKYYYDKYIN